MTRIVRLLTRSLRQDQFGVGIENGVRFIASKAIATLAFTIPLRTSFRQNETIQSTTLESQNDSCDAILWHHFQLAVRRFIQIQDAQNEIEQSSLSVMAMMRQRRVTGEKGVGFGNEDE